MSRVHCNSGADCRWRDRDMTPLGRQEDEEPYVMAWVRHHDKYGV